MGVLEYLPSLWLALFVCIGFGRGVHTLDDNCHDGCVLGGDVAFVDRSGLELEYGDASMAFSCSANSSPLRHRFRVLHIVAPEPGRHEFHCHRKANDPANSGRDEFRSSVLHRSSFTSSVVTEGEKHLACC